MKTLLPLLSVSCLLALSSPVRAHHEHLGEARACGIFWKGLPPKTAAVQGPTLREEAAGSKDLWRLAFVSRYRPVGAGFSALLLP